MLKVWGRADSSNVQAVMWCIGELGIEHQRIDAGHRFGLLNTPDFKALNPNQTIPVIQDGDQQALWESGAIIRYLASQYGDGSFWPEDPAKRAHVDQWAEWSKINIAMGFTGPVFWPVVRQSASERNESALERSLLVLYHYLSIAEDQLKHQSYLAADHLTFADIQFGHVLYRYFAIDIERPDLPRLRNYHSKLVDRPAFKAHVMVSYDSLKAENQ